MKKFFMYILIFVVLILLMGCSTSSNTINNTSYITAHPGSQPIPVEDSYLQYSRLRYKTNFDMEDYRVSDVPPIIIRKPRGVKTRESTVNGTSRYKSRTTTSTGKTITIRRSRKYK